MASLSEGVALGCCCLDLSVATWMTQEFRTAWENKNSAPLVMKKHCFSAPLEVGTQAAGVCCTSSCWFKYGLVQWECYLTRSHRLQDDQEPVLWVLDLL